MTSATYVLFQAPQGHAGAARGLLRVEGPDARDYLQGLISNDVRRIGRDKALYASFLTPQGKFLHDFFLIEMSDGALMIDCEGGRQSDLYRRLRMYRLRSKVDIQDVTADWAVAAIFGTGAADRMGLDAERGAARALDDGVVYVDPRLAAMGVRALLPAANAEEVLSDYGLTAGAPEDYERLRIELGLPDGSRDMVIEKAILLENGIDELNGIDWHKGCYMGQELTARTKYRGTVRKRLLPLQIAGTLPENGSDILQGEKVVGVIRTGSGDRALGLVRLEALENIDELPLKSGDAILKPQLPDWLSLADSSKS